VSRRSCLDIGIHKSHALVLARIGLTILVGTQQLEEKVDRKRLDALLAEYHRWLGLAESSVPFALVRQLDQGRQPIRPRQVIVGVLADSDGWGSK
jgi:hypothetical protein